MGPATAPVRVALLAAAGALVGGALFAGGGAGDGSLLWLGGAAAIVASVGGALALLGVCLPRPRLGRSGTVLAVVLVALAAWIGVGIVWSIEPDRSWSYLNRALVYLAFAAVGALLAAALARPFRTTAFGLAAVLGGVFAWSLLGKVVPAVGPDDVGHWIARLRAPIGYWNALALAADLAIPLGLWLASGRRRAGGALLLYAAILVTLLSYSRSGIAIGVLASVAWIVLARERFAAVVALLASAGAALVVLGIGYSLPGVTKDAVSHATRVHDGALFALPLLAGAIGAVAAVVLVARAEPSERTRRVVVGLTAALAAGAVAVALVALVVHAGGPGEFLHRRWVEFANPASSQVSQGAGRLDSLSSNNRWIWWNESWRVFTGSPWLGKGPGTFDLSHRLLRTNDLVALEPHNLAVQLLGETGVVGFLLGLAAAAAGLWVAWRAVLRAGVDRAPALALGLALPVWLLHALVDFTYDFAAVTAPVFLVAGVLAAGGRERLPAPRRRSLAGAAAALVAGIVILYSLAAPWLSARAVDAGYAALDRNDTAGAIAKARDAHRLNPLSLEPLFLEALARTEAGDLAEAFRVYRRRIALQPENWQPWYDMGNFLLVTAKQPCIAYDYLNRAYTLDRKGQPGEGGGPLDVARAVRNSGRCS